MIGPGPGARVMVPTRPVDFRKGPDALAALERFPQLDTSKNPVILS